jgi:hypothetical protein
VVAASGRAWAETDQGTASTLPWSGFWWQHKSGGLTGPLGKYDQVAGTQAAAWEKDNHVLTAKENWFGHCHAWSASCVSEKQPTQVRQVKQVSFGVGDQKGLLAACHGQDIANSYGQRFENPATDDPDDIYPDELWRVLQLYLKEKKIPLIMDMDPGPQVWNYPVYQYQVEYKDGGDGWYYAAMQLVAADDNVQPDYVGTQPILFNLTFRFKMQEGAVVAGSGQWTGNSKKDHPDFAWYPYVAVAENPEVNVAEVSTIVGYPVGGNNPTPPNPPNPPPTPPNPPPTPPTPPNPPAPPVDPDNHPAHKVSVQYVLSPDELVDAVSNKTSAFSLDMFVDKGDGGKYRSGEPIRISFRSGGDGYLYLIDVDSLGDLHLVFPQPGQANFIHKGVLYDFPAKDRQPWFTAFGHGQHDLKAMVTAQPIQITGFHDLPLPPESSTAGSGGQTQAVASPKRPSQAAGGQKMLLWPSAQERVRQRLLQTFRKGQPAGQTPVTKIGPFAQDVCSYFVLSASGRPRPGEKTGP